MKNTDLEKKLNELKASNNTLYDLKKQVGDLFNKNRTLTMDKDDLQEEVTILKEENQFLKH